MTKLTTYAMVTALSSGMWACSNDCEDADELVREKYESCGIVLGSPESREAVEPLDCTEALERSRRTFADCVEAASCEAITGRDSEAFDRYAACLVGE